MIKETKPSISSLQNISLFYGLPKSDLMSIRACLHEKVFQKGEILFFAGKPCERVFIVRSGRVKVFMTASSGREQILEILESNETCACNPGQASWCCTSTAKALTDCAVWFLSRDTYIKLANTNSKMAHSLKRLFAEKINRFSTLIEEVSLNDAQKRLAKFLINMSNNDLLKNKGDTFFIPFTREEIAQTIGSARETVVRYLYQFKRSNLIDIKPRQIIIRNKEGLEKLLY